MAKSKAVLQTKSGHDNIVKYQQLTQLTITAASFIFAYQPTCLSNTQLFLLSKSEAAYTKC